MDNPKLKAKELFDTFAPFMPTDRITSKKDMAKNCATICCDKLLIEFSHAQNSDGADKKRWDFYQQVRSEIEKI